MFGDNCCTGTERGREIEKERTKPQLLVEIADNLEILGRVKRAVVSV